MYASQTFTDTSQSRVMVRMLRAVDRASHSISSAFGLGSNIYLSNRELVNQALENIHPEANVSNCDFEPARYATDFHQYRTGNGTGFAWRIWEADGKWHAEARISHHSGQFTPQSTLLRSCEQAGFVCEEVTPDYHFHTQCQQQAALDNALGFFARADVDALRVPYLSGSWQTQFLANIRAYVDKCETEFAAQQRRADTDIELSHEPSDEDTLAKLRSRKLDFDTEE